jgi:hypothetical protein
MELEVMGHQKRIFRRYKNMLMSRRPWLCNISMLLRHTRGPGLMRVNSSTSSNPPVIISLLLVSELFPQE